MPRPYQYLVKIIECNKFQDLEVEVNSFLNTVFTGNLIDIRYEPLQTPMGTAYTAMIIYKEFPAPDVELK